MSAERAARQIVEAVRFGDPELVLTLAANVGAMANTTMPAVVAALAALANRMLPQPAGEAGNRHLKGRDLNPEIPSFATALTDHAAARNNEM
jgi:hypothetical protein